LGYVIKQHEARSGYAANKDRKNLVAAWNWGTKYMEPPLPEPNPCRVDKMPEIRRPRYVPPEDDFWQAYELAEGQDEVMLLTFLHLAARRGEVFGLQWLDVDFVNKRVRLWTRKRAGSNLEYDWLPMTKELREALLWWRENRPIKDKPHVFLCLDEKPVSREHYGAPFQYRLHFMRRLCKRAKVKAFGFHAIRHLSASILYKLGYDVRTIQAILRHRSSKTTERYLRSLGLEDLRKALDSLSERTPDVVDFGRVVINEDLRALAKNKKPSEEPSTPQTAMPKLTLVA
jgi:integrase